MLTAAIAEKRLSTKATAAVTEILDVLKTDYPYATSIVSSAHWADDIKREHDAYAFSSWHFIDYAFSDGVQCPKDIDLQGDHNILWGLKKQRAALASKTASVWQKAFAIRFLIHLVGDLHQPLHCIGRCSVTHPKGDQGGNRFPLAVPAYSNLHKFWDSMGGQYETSLEALCPYGKWEECNQNEGKRVAAVQAEAGRMMGLNPPSSLVDFDEDSTQGFEAWALESYAVARSGVVYENITENGAPTAFYTQRTQRITRERCVLGGYRLAVVLNGIDWPALAPRKMGGIGSSGVPGLTAVILAAFSAIVGIGFGCCFVEAKWDLIPGGSAAPGEGWGEIDGGGDKELEIQL